MLVITLSIPSSNELTQIDICCFLIMQQKIRVE